MKEDHLDKGQAKGIFTHNFRDHMEGKFGFQEWFEKHKELESRYGPEPWPGLEEYSAVSATFTQGNGTPGLMSAIST